MPDRLRRFADLRAWMRSLAKESTHAGVTALLGAVGTNTAEAYFPKAFENLAMDLRQTAALFLSAAFVAALRRIQHDTAPTRPPFAP